MKSQNVTITIVNLGKDVAELKHKSESVQIVEQPIAQQESVVRSGKPEDNQEVEQLKRQLNQAQQQIQQLQQQQEPIREQVERNKQGIEALRILDGDEQEQIKELQRRMNEVSQNRPMLSEEQTNPEELKNKYGEIGEELNRMNERIKNNHTAAMKEISDVKEELIARATELDFRVSQLEDDMGEGDGFSFPTFRNQMPMNYKNFLL